MDIKWDLKEIKNKDDVRRVAAKNMGGIYVLCASKPIHKPGGKDEAGILYIGCTKARKLGQRLKLAKNQWSRKDDLLSFDHSCFFYVLDFKDDNLTFDKNCVVKEAIKGTAQPLLYYQYTQDAENLEAKLLQGHVIKYGCLPPFNFTGASIADIEERYCEDNKCKKCDVLREGKNNNKKQCKIGKDFLCQTEKQYTKFQEAITKAD